VASGECRYPSFDLLYCPFFAISNLIYREQHDLNLNQIHIGVFKYFKSSNLHFYSFVGVKKYGIALDYFLTAITLPALALSAVVTASLKAARLVSLIELGTSLEIPK
jgi:hypothetical protein